MALLAVVGLLAAPSVTPVAAQDAEAPICEARTGGGGENENWCSDGTTSTVSADGSTMTVESSDGSTAVATKDSGGVTVEVDGVTYTYAFNRGSPAQGLRAASQRPGAPVH